MKIIRLLYLTLIITGLDVRSQTFCFTPPSSENSNLYSSSLGFANISDTYCLKIYIHVIRRNDGTGGQPVNKIKEAVNLLDLDFNPHGIYFHWDGQINYIDDDLYYRTPSTSIFDINNHDDGIDIYLFDDKANAGGRANGVGESSELWVSGVFWKNPYNSLITSRVLSHEMGHVLFLWHTHHQVEIGCKEYVDGRNSSSCGDYVSDTPADPHLRFDVDFPNCNWNGNENDPAGVPYRPDEKLIMSYSHVDCMNYFSKGQGQRMRNAIAVLPHLNNSIINCNDSCPNELSVTKSISSGQIDNQKAKYKIEAYNIISQGATANYIAGQSIILKPGFHAKNGSKFSASIADCDVTTAVNTIKQEESNTYYKQPVKINETEPVGGGIRVLPNPTNGIVEVLFNYEEDTIYKAAIYNSLGQFIKVENINKKNQKLNLNNLKSGTYLIRVYKTNSIIGTAKIILEN